MFVATTSGWVRKAYATPRTSNVAWGSCWIILRPTESVRRKSGEKKRNGPQVAAVVVVFSGGETQQIKPYGMIVVHNPPF